MANIVGDLKAYHDGVSYSVAELYDDEISELRDEKHFCLVHFDSDGIVDECGNNWVYYVGADTSQTVTVQEPNFSSSLTDTSTAFANDGLKQCFLSTADSYFELDKIFELGGTESFTIDCWIRGDNFKATTSGAKIYHTIWTMTTEDNYIFSIQHAFLAATGKTTGSSCSIVKTAFNGSQSSYQFNYATGISQNMHVNILRFFTIKYNASTGSFGVYFEDTNDMSKMTLKFGGQSNRRLRFTKIRLGGSAGAGIAEFRIVRDSQELNRVPSKPQSLIYPSGRLPVTGNVAFKTAGGTVYAPLSSDTAYKSPPCINVRHNGVNYFAVK